MAAAALAGPDGPAVAAALHMATEALNGPDGPAAAAALRDLLNQYSPQRSQPVDQVQWVPIEQVRANDYNPNSVAGPEMELLKVSIERNGYTQPVVAVAIDDHYEIVDGFHRYYIMKTCPEIAERCNGLLPVVVIDGDRRERMAATVRHNRARGRHSVNGMGNMIFRMLEDGWDESAICTELGMEPEEVVRLKHISGFSKLYATHEYRKAWQSRGQIRTRREWESETGEPSQAL